MITLGFKDPDKKRPRRRTHHFRIALRLCQQIARFLRENQAQGCQAYLSFGGGRVGLFLVSTSEIYDFDLGDKLAEFAAPYIERGLLGSVTLLPAATPEQLAGFFDAKKALRVEIDHA